MSFAVNVEKAANGWRQKGYADGFARRDPNPPKGDEERAAYLAGHRRGAEARSKVGS